MPAVFQQKFYNAEAWGKYLDYLLLLKPTQLLLSGAVQGNSRVANALATQTGSLVAQLPYYSDGTEDDTTQDYDGVTDIVAVTPPTYLQTFGSTGKTKAWTETDFSIDLTTARSVDAVYARLANWRRYIVEQPMVLSILQGLFTANGTQTAKTDFITNHSSTVGKVTPESLNNALDMAAGQYKSRMSLFICHSHLATQLENLQMLEYIKYTTPAGVQTDTTLATWNGRLLLIDDQVNMGAGAGTYIGYALGPGAITLQDLDVQHPIEPYRDPLKAGGMDTLIVRNRYGFGAKGFSFVPTGATKYSNAQLAAGTSWKLIEGSESPTPSVIPHQEIPIARIIFDPSQATNEPLQVFVANTAAAPVPTKEV